MSKPSYGQVIVRLSVIAAGSTTPDYGQPIAVPTAPAAGS